MIAVNGMKYFDVTETLVDRFLTSGKKPWNLDRCLDLMDIFKGTHYANTSVDEMCYHFEIESPKTDLDGSMVSEEYWNNGIDKINKYVKQDVFANINIFKKMRFEQSFNSFIDKNDITTIEPFTEEQPILVQLFETKQFGKEVKDYLISQKPITDEDKINLIKIILSNYQAKGDKVGVKKNKEKEVTDFINSI
jgi:hypothetical protein